MAADTMGSWSGDVSYGFKKIGRTKKYLVGFAGRFNCIIPLYDWIMDCEDKKLDPTRFYQNAGSLYEGVSDTSALMLEYTGKLWVVSTSGCGSPMMRPFDAIGSGGRFAAGAMHAGATAVESIEIAIELDENTGGEVIAQSFDGNLQPFAPF